MEQINGKDLLIRELKEDLKKTEAERDFVQYCLDETKKSFSYRLGLTLTCIPRKLAKSKNKKH